MQTRGALRSSPLPEQPAGAELVLAGAAGLGVGVGPAAGTGRGGRGKERARESAAKPREGEKGRRGAGLAPGLPPTRAAVCGWVPRGYRAVLPPAREAGAPGTGVTPSSFPAPPCPAAVGARAPLLSLPAEAVAPSPGARPAVVEAAAAVRRFPGKAVSAGGAARLSGRAAFYLSGLASGLGLRSSALRPVARAAGEAGGRAFRCLFLLLPELRRGGKRGKGAKSARPSPPRPPRAEQKEGTVVRPSAPRGAARHAALGLRPQIRRGDPLNLSILVSGGKETNEDSLSNGE